MAIDPANAAAAYRANAVGAPAAFKPSEPPGQSTDVPDSSFMDLVRDVAQDTIEANRHAEQVAVDAAAGRADVTELVTAIAEAENTLQTVVTVRDRVISAYQEILRMPI